MGTADTGAAYVFKRNQGGSGTWGEVTTLAASDVELVGDFLVRARFLKLSIFNESGGTLDFTGSNSDIDLQENFGDQA